MSRLTRIAALALLCAWATTTVAHAAPFHEHVAQLKTSVRAAGKRLPRVGRLAAVGLLTTAVALGGCASVGSHQERLTWNHQWADKPAAEWSPPDSHYMPSAIVIHYGSTSHADKVKPPAFEKGSTTIPTHYDHTLVVSPTAKTAVVTVPGLKVLGIGPKTYFRAAAVGMPQGPVLTEGQDPTIPISSDYSNEASK